MSNRLTQILDTKREHVAAGKALRSVADLDAAAVGQSAPRGFRACWKRRRAMAMG